MKREDGGPAFPRAHGDDGRWASAPSGMSLRDYFAGHAMAGLASRFNAEMLARYFSGHYDGREAVVAYAIADAMIAERLKP